MTIIIIVSLILLSINLFGILNISNTVLLSILLVLGVRYVTKPTTFRWPIYMMFIGILISFIPADIYRGQSYIETFKASANYFYIFFFFVLLRFRPSLKQIEKIIVIFALISSTVYILQFILLQVGVIFLPLSDASVDAGSLARFRILGSGIYSLGFFLGVNKYIVYKKWDNLLFAIYCYIPILLQSFRTSIFFSIVLGFVLIVLTTKGNISVLFKYLLLSLIVAVLILQIPVVNEKVQYMLNKQIEGEETFTNKDYVRWICLNYYWNNYFVNPVEYFVGSGSPYVDSPFGRLHKSIQAMGLWYVDLGLIGTYFLIGPLAVISMIWFGIKTCFLKKTTPYFYISVWYIFMIVSSITTVEYLRPGNFIVHAIALYAAYIVDKCIQTNKSVRIAS